MSKVPGDRSETILTANNMEDTNKEQEVVLKVIISPPNEREQIQREDEEDKDSSDAQVDLQNPHAIKVELVDDNAIQSRGQNIRDLNAKVETKAIAPQNE